MNALESHDQRRRELAAIHVAKAQLGLDDGTYRDMLFALARVRSAADLDYAGRRAVIEHLRARGFRARPAPAARARHGKRPVVRADLQALIGKLEALLADAGRPWRYAEAMLHRMCHVDAWQWASAEDLRKLVAALEYDRRRRAARSAQP